MEGMIDRDRPNRQDRLLKVLVVLALGSAFTSGLSMEIRNLTFTLAYGVTLLLFGYELLYAAFTDKRVPLLFRDDISLLLYFFVLSNLFSSMLFSTDRMHSIKGCAPLVACLLLYSVLRAGLRMLSEASPRFLKLFGSLNLFSAGFGLACMILAMMTGRENIGVSFEHLSIGMRNLGGLIPPSIRSFSVEPNLFSIGTAAVLCLSLGNYLLGTHPERKLLWMGVPALAILFAYTRSVYGALVIALVVLMVLARKTRVIYRVTIAAVVVSVVLSLVYLALPEDNSARKAIGERFATIADFQGGTGGGRWIGYQLAWKSYLAHPVLGNGTLTADTWDYNPYTGEYQHRMGAAGWLTGSGIQALHDTGIIGFLILLTLFGVLLTKNYRVYRSLTNDDSRRGWLLGFLGGNMVLFIASQLSSPLWTAFPYVFWAVNAEFLAQCRGERQASSTIPVS